MMKDNNTAPDRANANATQQPKGKSKKRSRSKRGKKKSKEKKSSPKQKTSASIVNSTGSFDEAEAEELYPEQIITSVWEKSREKANAPKRVTGTSLTKPGDDNMDFSSSENEEGEIAGDAKENSKGKEDKSADDEKSDKKASKKQLLVQAKQRLKEVQEKRQQLLEKKLQTEQEKQQAKYTASLDPSPSYGKYTATMGQEATAAASKPNSYNRKKFTIDEAQTKMREALQKKLQFMKKRNQYLQSSRGRQQVNRLSALEDNALNSLVIEDISSTGPEEKVRFVTVFAPPINVTEGAQASIGDPVDDTEMPGQFEDPNEEDHTANAAPVVTDESNARKNMQVRSAGQFDDPDKDAFLEIIPQTAAGSVDGDPGAKGIVPEEAPKPTSNSLADRLPKMLSKGERFNHLKSINALKRKMELRRKAIELKEKLQRLEQRGGGEVGRGSSESHRYQRQASTPSDNCSDGGDLTPPQQPSSREGKDQLSVTEADTTEQLQSQPVPAKPKIKYTKEELEKRRVKAQQNMDVTQMKHLVSKQAYLLDEQHKKVTNHEHDIRECDQLTTQLQEDLKTQSDKIVSLSVRQEIIDEMLQEKAKLLMAKRCELYQLQTRKKTSRNGMEIDENEAEDDDDDDDDDVLDE